MSYSDDIQSIYQKMKITMIMRQYEMSLKNMVSLCHLKLVTHKTYQLPDDISLLSDNDSKVLVQDYYILLGNTSCTTTA
jgi:hypothetical protein